MSYIETELAPMPVAVVPEQEVKVVDAPIESKPAVTPGQARIEAVAQTLAAAYQQASLLKLTPEEANALAEDFPDEAFSLGAGGDPNLLYIEHSYLRQRLNKVLGVGACVPIRRREWAEEFTYWKDGKQAIGNRVYVDLVLLVRGAVVGEAIGDAVYYPSNAKTNYSDALESAKSNAFRRCCKEFGVGLQAWMRGWAEGWKKRHEANRTVPVFIRKQPEAAPQSPAPVQTSSVAQKPAQEAPKAQETPEDRRQRWIKACQDAGGGLSSFAEELFEEMGVMQVPAKLTEFPVDFIPATKKVADELLAEIRKRAGTGTPPPAKAAPAAKPDNRERISGVIKHVSEKSGTSTKGKAWTCYSILITSDMAQTEGGTWISTFSATMGPEAKKSKGRSVTCIVERTERGVNLCDDGLILGEIIP